MTKTRLHFDPALPAPRAAKKPLANTRHGITRTDDYAWLRADNWQDVFRDTSVLDADIRAHLESENAYQDAQMADTVELQKTLFAEMKGRIKEDDSSVPMKDGPFAYGTRFVTGGQHAHYLRVPRGGGAEETILDGDKEAAGHAYFRIASVGHAPDHARLLWSYDDSGSEFFTIKIRDLAAGTDLTETVTDTGGGTWDGASKGFFYTRLDANHRPVAIHYHAIGASDPDPLIYEEKDPGFFMDVGGSRLNDFIFIGINDHETSEYRILPADRPDAEPLLIAPRVPGVQYDLSEGGDVFFVLTNDGAKDFKIMQTPVAAPGKENWTEVVPHVPGRLILSVMAFKNYLVRLEREDGLPRIVIRDRSTGEEHAIAFDEEAFSLGLGGSYEYDTDVIRFSYSSMTTPAQLYDYDMGSRERTLLKTQEVPSGHTASDYVTRRVMAQAHDGERVPVSLLYRKDTPLDGSAPCLLYGYGAYGIAIPASFNTNCLSLVDRGFVYAIAHIRGGKDRGYRWYDEGKREKKTNTFNDFISSAQHLIQAGFTSQGRIIAQGGSAGGMLMGAAANMAPELFGGIIAEVPFVDVLNTMLDDTLPLTPPEWPEWGNPVTSEADYKIIASYSPYDNVTEQAYPPLLAIAGLTDPRVTYWEPAKWLARLRELKTDTNPALFKVHMTSGHGGASGRFSRLEEVAFSYAFAVKAAGDQDIVREGV